MTDGAAIVRERIAREATRRTGVLDLGQLGLTVLPEALFALKHLRRLNLGSAITDEDGLWVPSSADIAVNDIEPSLDRLIELPELEALSLIGCRLANLGGIAALAPLRQLYCSFTQVSDLQPLVGLAALQTLDCRGTQVSDLRPLAGLTALQSLDCSGTPLSDLGPLAGLPKLRMLNCFNTQVSDLKPLTSLPKLQTLYCYNTQVRDLGPLVGLTSLRTLRCCRTQVSDLGPLAGLTALLELDCSYTSVNNLEPLVKLTALRTLDCSKCVLTDFPRWLLHRPSLKHLILYDCHLPSVPAAILSQSRSESCLAALRAHVRDLQPGEVVAADVKLMVLGNGRVGKTQLCRRLQGEAYDEGAASTHGIIVTSAPLPASTNGPPARLQIWDFGGQDIYHGTHALFMRTSAIFLLAWTPALEDAQEHEHDGTVFRNHPLAYWVDYVRHLGGAGSPVLVVQTQCDGLEDDAVCPVSEADLFKAFDFRQTLRTSARTDRGRASLNDALAEATTWLRGREGIAVIGLGWHRVQQRLEAMRDTDSTLAPEARQYRTITQAQFRRLCNQASGISSPDHLLSYLHNVGIVFYRPGLFHDAIILDQGWILEAIYAVFHRGKSYTKIRRQHGRFTRSDLEDWVWQGHSIDEQELFLSMMQSCGICFEHRRLGLDDEGEAEYIAPDLLPDRTELQVELDQKWDADEPAEAAVFEYAMLHPGLMRSVISRIGQQAGLAAEYWKGGIYVYETHTKSRGLIEQEMIDDWRGRICVQTQRGRAADLLQRMMVLIEAEQNRVGMTPAAITTSARAEAMASGAIRTAEPGQETGKMVFTQESSPAPERYVSYAWGDDTAEGKKRQKIVEDLCAAAEAKGIKILRDKDEIGLGERISKFMRRLGQGDRVFIVLSDKYLKSPFCMYELSEVWRNSRQDEEEFLKRIRVYALPDATIGTLKDRLAYAVYWKKQHAEVDALVKEHGNDILGDKGYQDYRHMKQFAGNVTDILTTVSDILQPRSFDELVKYGWQD